MNEPGNYRIRVLGHLPANWSTLLDGMALNCEPEGTTMLTGVIRDQAALYGLIAKLQNYGLTLISIEKIGTFFMGRRN